MTTKPETSIVDVAKSKLEGDMIYIKNARWGGTMPLEERLEDGSINLSDCDYDTHGRRINERSVRDLEFGEYKVMKLNLNDPSDRDFYENRVLPWYNAGDDPRIANHGITIVEGGNFEGEPFPNWDSNKADRCLGMVELSLGDDADFNAEMLERCARYELQRVYPPNHPTKAGKRATRQAILKGLDKLAMDNGIEATDGDVVEVDG